MKFSEFGDVSFSKQNALKERLLSLGIDLTQVQEQFTKGSGPGGQKTNKTSNRVLLRYDCLGLVVSAHHNRKRSVNRFLALRELADQVEMRLSPHTSERLRQQARIRHQKKRRSRRHKNKLNT